MSFKGNMFESMLIKLGYLKLFEKRNHIWGKRIISTAVMFLLVALLLAGCASDINASETTTSADTSTVIVAEINGQAIYKNDYDSMYSQLLYTAYYNNQDIEDESIISSIRQAALDEAVAQEVCRQKLLELGYYDMVTDDEKAQAESNMINYLVTNIVDLYYLDVVIASLEDGYTDEQLLATKQVCAETLFEEIGVTRERFLEENYIYPIVYDKAYKMEVGDIVSVEGEVKAQYDANVAADQEATEEDPISYIVSMNNGTTVYYVPSGVRMVREVLIMIDEEMVESISMLRSSGKDAAADTLREEALSAIENQANEALGKLEAGASFDELIAEYNPDTYMPEEGYPVMEDTTVYEDSYVTAAMGLTEFGRCSSLVATDIGYYILEYYGDKKEGPVPYDDVKDEISSELQASMQGKVWREMINQWISEATIVEYDENI